MDPVIVLDPINPKIGAVIHKSQDEYFVVYWDNGRVRFHNFSRTYLLYLRGTSAYKVQRLFEMYYRQHLDTTKDMDIYQKEIMGTPILNLVTI